MPKVIQFQHPDGRVLTLTQDDKDSTIWHSRFEDGSTISDKIKASFMAGEISKKR